jgi:5-oxoprolinase (ATP-hydrolysing) subunit A
LAGGYHGAMSDGPRIDLNADVGESLGPWRMGEDEGLIPLVTSVNVACGAHAGDPAGIARTIALARAAGAAVGAHPGYPDLIGFGRRDLDMEPAELEASIIHQVGGVAALARAAGAEVVHVKAHGALYNRAARDDSLAATIARAVRLVSPDLVLVGLAGSRLLEAGRSEGLAVASEAFADRAYEADGSLRSRRLPGAVLLDPAAAATQAVSIAVEGRVRAWDGSAVGVAADTICLHGDTPGAVAIARAVRAALEEAGVTVVALARAR